MLGLLSVLGPMGQHQMNHQHRECLQGALHAQPHGQQEDAGAEDTDAEILLPAIGSEDFAEILAGLLVRV